MNSEPVPPGWPVWAKIVTGILIIAAGIVLGIVLHEMTSGVGDPPESTVAAKRSPRPDPGRIQRLEEKKTQELRRSLREGGRDAPSATGGSSHAGVVTGRSSAVLGAGAEASFAALEDSLGAQIGVAVAPFGSDPPVQIGSLTGGHAWSSFKVPIVATVMREGGLNSEQEAQAYDAITASDNEAAAALFADLGSIDAASAKLEDTLSEAGYSTTVATSPPPSGAVSTWGQTDWSLVNSVGFYRALACDRLAAVDSGYVLSLMESVISEQQWGLGEVGIEGQVAIKAGWGPDGSASGPYLVRQAGILRSGERTGVVVTIAAQDSSGSFEAGVQDLGAVAGWVRDNVSLDAGSC